MKRASEKTFGPSPESEAPRKRRKLLIPKARQTSSTTSADDDTASDSDTLFVPSGKAGASGSQAVPTASKTPQESRKAKDTQVETSDEKTSIPRVPLTASVSKDSGCAPPEPTVSPPSPGKPTKKPSRTPKTSKSTATSSRPLKATMRTGNILEKLGKFPGFPAPSDSSKNVEDHNESGATTKSKEIPKPAQKDTLETLSKAQKSTSRKSPQNNRDKELDGTIIVAVDLEIQYTGDGSYKWGFQIPSDVERHKWFKLALDSNSCKIDIGLANEYPDSKAVPPEHDQESEEVIKDYLTSLRQHFEAVLNKNLPNIALSTRVDWVVTVPAIWSDLAVAKTKRCAERAGMGAASSLRIVSEPEAAAMWALQEIVPNSLIVGDTFVICDAGGGTVDLITYRVKSLKPILRVEEVVPGRGKKCGSTFLNRRFELFLRDKLSSHPCWREDVIEDAMKRFEIETKRYYDGSKTDVFQIPVPTFPDDPAYDVRRARMTLKGVELYNIFEPVMQDVIGLVKQQINATKEAKSLVKEVLLVGGFGESEYLYQRLRQAVVHDCIEVSKPPYGWTAVQRGALLKGLADHSPKNTEILVAGRSARNHYGTESAKEWDGTVHPESQRVWSAANSRFEVNTYDWFITKKDTVSEKKPIRLNYYTTCLASLKKLDPITVTIVRCEDPEDGGAPVFVGDGQVTPHANLEVPLSLIPTKNLKKRQSEDGQQWYIVDFALKVTRTSAEFHYDLMHNKKSYGRVSADFI
ncbi:MAG: hypothetical protein Q9166_006533 [cf. Caloplaca sp. 2 TL-2023]